MNLLSGQLAIRIVYVQHNNIYKWQSKNKWQSKKYHNLQNTTNVCQKWELENNTMLLLQL